MAEHGAQILFLGGPLSQCFLPFPSKNILKRKYHLEGHRKDGKMTQTSPPGLQAQPLWVQPDSSEFHEPAV